MNIVPFDFALKAESGMDFTLFTKAVVCMSAIAYRDCAADVTPQNKVKALLLYMWKAVNDSDKTIRMISSTRINAVTSYAGSLNLFGSGLFSDQFLANWLKDGFTDYTTLRSDATDENGAAVSDAVIRV